jgi:uncharacterized protein YjiS (DUF1127 family)
MLKFIKDVQASYQKYLIANSTIKELSSLTDKELKDIGISRSSIRSIAWDIKDNEGLV